MDPFSKRDKRISLIVTGILIMLGTAVSIFGGYVSRASGINVLLDGSGMIIAGALCGYVPGLICVFFSFIYKIINDSGTTYVLFLYMVAALLASWFSVHKWFRSRIKTLLAALILTVVTGCANAFVITVTEGRGIDTSILAEVVAGFAKEVPECLLSVFIIYMLFNYLPERFRKYLPNGIFYTDNRDLVKYIEERIHERSRLSAKITAITAVEAVFLGLASAYFANVLIGSMNFNPGGVNSAPVQTVSGQTQIFNEGPLSLNQPFSNNNLDFQSGLAFDARLLMLLFTFAVIIATAVNMYAQRRIAMPIKKMSKAMSSFAYGTEEKRVEGVDNIHKLDIDTHDEIEELYQAIDTTVDDFTGYIRQIREEERLKNDLKIAKAASEAKSNFLSSMSHEIRTPINAVLGFDEMIIRDSDDDNVIQYAQDIQNAGKTLLGLINDILDFSKIEAGKLEILPVEYELSSTINDLVNMISVMAKEKNLSFDVNVDRTTPHLLFGDEIRLKQIILNILTNAVKYTEKGGVTFNTGYEKTGENEIYLCVSVKDTGIGIKQEDMDRLFSPFERIEETRNRAILGTGLGMSIVKQLLGMMDSKLEVSSVYGEGSEFSFKVRQKVTKWEAIGNLSDAFRRYLPHAQKTADNFHADKARILVVDDTKVNLTVVKGLLKNTGIKVDTAESGKETLQMICREKYDMVLIDHMMPEMDGIETLHAMTGLEGNLNRDIPWIVLTANAISGAREQYIKEGFTDYLSKPVDYIKMKNMFMKYFPEGLIEIRDDTEEAQTPENGPSKDDRLKKCEGIDIEAAVTNCGSIDVLDEVIKDFLVSIPSKSALIEKYWKEKDLHDYTIQVHALKSSARLIGAMKLSKDARYLEERGGSEDISEVDSKTPDLLKLYRSYSEKLAPAAEKHGGEDAGKPQITREKLKEYLSGIRELVEAFDFDNADKAMKLLEDYSMPDDFAGDYEKLKTMFAAVDRDGILELIK